MLPSQTFHQPLSQFTAASALGAGFGGSVWALVRQDDAQGFVKCWQENYESRFPEPAERASFFVTGAGPAAMRL